MNILVIKNFGEGLCKVVNKDCLLKTTKKQDDNLGNIEAIDLTVVDIRKNIRFEVAPKIKKYNVIKIVHASEDRDYIVFTTAEMKTIDKVAITFYRFDIYERRTVKLTNVNVNITELGSTTHITAFILDKNNIMIQFRISKTDGTDEKYEIVHYGAISGNTVDVTIPLLVDNGIDSIISLPNQMCAIKIGCKKDEKEYIGVFLLNQFISELSMNIIGDAIKIIEENDSHITFKNLKKENGNVCYIMYDCKNNSENIVVYNQEKQVKRVRINTYMGDSSDVIRTFIANGEPVVVVRPKDEDADTELIDLSVQNVVSVLEEKDEIRFICGDLVVMTEHEKPLIGKKDVEYITVYKYPKIYDKPVVKVRKSFKQCVVTDNEIIIITK